MKLERREKSEAVMGAVAHEIGAGRSAKSAKFRGGEVMEIVASRLRVSRVRGGGKQRSAVNQMAGNVGGRRDRWIKEGLGEGEPEVEGERGNRIPAVDGRRIDGKEEGKITGDASGASEDVVANGIADGGAMVVAKTKGDKIVDEKESRGNGGAATTSFESGVARAAGNMTAGGDQLS